MFTEKAGPACTEAAMLCHHVSTVDQSTNLHRETWHQNTDVDINNVCHIICNQQMALNLTHRTFKGTCENDIGLNKTRKCLRCTVWSHAVSNTRSPLHVHSSVQVKAVVFFFRLSHILAEDKNQVWLFFFLLVNSKCYFLNFFLNWYLFYDNIEGCVKLWVCEN